MDALTLLRRLSCELAELEGTAVDEVPAPIDAATFAREYVGRNKPVIIRGGAAHWPAMSRWTRAYLRAKAGDAIVTVNVTPNGRGDAVTPYIAADGSQQLCFCKPHERRMPLSDFITLFDRTRSRAQRRAAAAARRRGGTGEQQQQQQQQDDQQQQEDEHERADEDEDASEVPYLSHQNGSLAAELPQLLADVDEHLPFAAAAFGPQVLGGGGGGGDPPLVNLWIGDERAATTFHKDCVENLYAVVKGRKRFHLLPPCDAFRLAPVSLPAATYAPAAERNNGGGGSSAGRSKLVPVLDADGARVAWSPVDPEPADRAAAAARAPHFFDPGLPPPRVADVGQGDVLYLPALWHHYVGQRAEPATGGWVVAVNYWYDMHFGAGWAHFRLCEALATAAGLVPASPPPPPGLGDDDDEEDGASGSDAQV